MYNQALKVHRLSLTDERCDILVLTDDEFQMMGQTDTSKHRYGFLIFSPLFPHSPHKSSFVLCPCLSCCLVLHLPEVKGPRCKGVCPTPPTHPKSSVDSLKGHKAMDGFFSAFPWLFSSY